MIPFLIIFVYVYEYSENTKKYKFVNLHNREEAQAAIQEGQQQLEVLRRQAVLGKLYPSARSVMEGPTAIA